MTRERLRRATVVLVGRQDRPEAALTAQTAVDWLRAHGHLPVASEEDCDGLAVEGLERRADPFEGADLVLSIGGDGTMLRAVSLLGGAAVPVLGVNVGHLGYLAELEPAQVEIGLQRFFEGEFTTERRLVLDVAVQSSAGRTGNFRALNEASLEKTKSGQTVRLGVRIDGAAFTTFQADGLLIATPTGSTAYALSARGPIVSPAHQAILVTPLAPHMLFDRTLVLDPSEIVEIEVVGDRDVVLTVDGQELMTLRSGDVVRCTASPAPAFFVRLDPKRFHQVLKTKFGLADR